MAPRTAKVQTKTTSRRSHAIANGYRSGLEERVADELNLKRIVHEFEPIKIPFTPPSKERTYTPDFILENGVIIETKGRFLTADRQKHKYIKEQYPDLDIRFVFQRADQKITKGSKTSYADWCDRYGFTWVNGSIPQEWCDEAPHKENLRHIKTFKTHKGK